jgi:hypothetical protein
MLMHNETAAVCIYPNLWLNHPLLAPTMCRRPLRSLFNPAPAGSCASCSTKLASYYCSICHLWDDEPGRAIYHCPFCNVCRRGQGLGVDFFHCMQCNACMSLSLFNTHTCR